MINPHTVRNTLKREGLFSAHRWRISEEPFHLSSALHQEIESLGRILLQFYRSINLLYFQSVSGKMPRWISELMDAGKPSWLIELQRHRVFKSALPRVIRPDLLLTEEGIRITELDSVPGGIGLLDCLQKIYFGRGTMQKGFHSIFDEDRPVKIIVSDESDSYRPEMEYLARQLGTDRFQVVDEHHRDFPSGCSVYRFFELFDLENIPCAKDLFERALQKEISLTPPPKTILEEKLWLALLWNRKLRDFWRQELGSLFFDKMLQMVPRSWILDPHPLPYHAEHPQLGIHDWSELSQFTQSQRELVIKISGFSEKAWGSRGVWIGSDLSKKEWTRVVEESLRQFGTSPHLLMRFTPGKTIPASWFDFETGTRNQMNARVRLCPYYFVKGDPQTQGRALHCGTLATLCADDKKIIHGMSDAILLPAAPETKPAE
ncbi:MAG: hypothetical protein M0Q48_07170 [Verrucomicrobia bacterium]|nr:hypothetical protein [Verrucomicrobiota bacterium]